MSYWMDTSVDEVVFLRPLVFPLSQDVESGRVGRTGALKHDLLDLAVLETRGQNLINSQGHPVRT